MYVVQTDVNGGSELLIFVPRAVHGSDLSLSLVAPFGASKSPRLAQRIKQQSEARHRARAVSFRSTYKTSHVWLSHHR